MPLRESGPLVSEVGWSLDRVDIFKDDVNPSHSTP